MNRRAHSDLGQWAQANNRSAASIDKRRAREIARTRALARLRDRHRPEFDRLFRSELRKLGLR
jgi:hypothetical protein